MDASPSFLLLSLLIFTPISFLTIPFTISKCGRAVGWYICKKTASRKELLLSRAEAEEKEHRLQNFANGDEEWEKTESHTTDSSTSGDKASKEWSGVIGFFHPFWFVFDLSGFSQPSILSSNLATPAVEANASYGLPFVRSNGDGPEPFV